MTTDSIAWERFAEDTLTGQKTSEQRILELLAEPPAQTPPIALARRARHRKPNRRRAVIAKAAGASLLVAAIGTLAAAAGHVANRGTVFGGIAPTIVLGHATHTSPAPVVKTSSDGK